MCAIVGLITAALKHPCNARIWKIVRQPTFDLMKIATSLD